MTAFCKVRTAESYTCEILEDNQSGEEASISWLQESDRTSEHKIETIRNLLQGHISLSKRGSGDEKSKIIGESLWSQDSRRLIRNRGA